MMCESIFTWVDEQYDKIAVEEAIMSDPVSIGDSYYDCRWYTGQEIPSIDSSHCSNASLISDLAEYSFLMISPLTRPPRGYVENVAHAIALAATSEQAAGRVYNICEEPTLPELEWRTRIAKQLNWPGRFVVLPRERTPEHLLLPGNTAQHVVATSERIRTELRYKELVEIEEAIHRTAAWEQQKPAQHHRSAAV